MCLIKRESSHNVIVNHFIDLSSTKKFLLLIWNIVDRITKYNKVLGLKGSVNADELRQLYRDRAKQLHPDRNSDPSSHEQFILLGEAYEFYRQLLHQLTEEKRDHFFKSKKYPEHYYKEKWNIDKRMAARKRAASMARKRYKEFETRGYSKRLDKMFYILDLFRFVAALGLLFILPIFLFYQDQIRGLTIALFIQVITYKLWSRVIKRILFRSKKQHA